MHVLRALLGIAFFCVAAWLLSSHRKRFPWRVVVFGLLLQVGLASFILGTDAGLGMFEWFSDVYLKVITVVEPGTSLVFGGLATSSPDGIGFPLAFAASGLPVIIFFSALMAVLYHVGVMQILIWVLAKVMSALMGVSGAESMAVAANVFVGQTEAPLVVRPFVPKMTLSELNALMCGGFATIAGSVMAVYIGVLGPEYGPHLLTASVMSAPAAFLVAKILQPETEVSATGQGARLSFDRTSTNLIEAAANGTSDGLKLWLNVVAMLIAFIALVALIDMPIGWIGEQAGFGEGLSLKRVFGWVFSPVAWAMGIDGWHDCRLFGSLLGTKIAINEFVAFTDMHDMLPGASEAAFEHARSAKMAAYALCGFANFSSIGIQIGGLSPLAPERKTDLSKLALRAMIGGAFASWMTASIAGAFLS
jgi:CNT family concentrative nucleoside transporter